MARAGKRTPKASAPAYDIVAPRAESMFESLRAFGYNLHTAVADLLDNSLTAGAKNIHIRLEWNGQDSWLRIEDDGAGMTQADLVTAMLPGSRNPREERAADDLGRFGLGLKTASLSQARRLAVRSKAAGHREASRCWDLDVIQEVKDWALLKADLGEDTEGRLASVPGESGTVVLWEKMDRVVGDAEVDDAGAHSAFLGRVKEIDEHLAMVFHRWLAGPRAVKLFLNGVKVVPWDPFMSEHAACQALPEERIGRGPREVVVQPFVLPHQSKAPNEHDAAAGPKGWNAQQGFYIYRNRRLLVSGDWLGFFRQEEHFKLARLRVDIGNALDEDWKIDVRKAQANPPDAVRSRLKQIATATRGQAAEVYRHRGKVLERQAARTPVAYVWLQSKRRGKTLYRINHEHPLIQRALNAKEVTRRDIKAALRLIEETIPVNYIMGTLDEHTNHVHQPYEGASADLQEAVRLAADSYRKQGMKDREIRKILLSNEPFQHYPEIIAALDLKEE